MYQDRESCLQAVRSRDTRFDGWFITAVTSTGIYCRPSCPAMTPRAEHVRFYPAAAAAQAAGFRACKRCRPDASPGSPEWNLREDLVARAVRLVGEGVVDTDGVEGLARRLGYSVRQVERLVTAELGVGPLALARAQRAQTARVLIETTTLPMGDVAFAAGFASVRSFNDTVRAVFAQTPSQLRHRSARHRANVTPAGLAAPQHHTNVALAGSTAPQHLRLRLPFRAPLHSPSLFGHLAATAVPGIERWVDGVWERTLRLPRGAGLVRLRPACAQERHVTADLWLQDLRDLTSAITRCRRLLDLDADPVAIDQALGQDPLLAPAIAARPGVRLPGSVEAAEMALRAVLGQQVSTASAATTTGRLVRDLGDPLPDSLLLQQGQPGLLFPRPEQLAALAPDDPRLPGMPASRRRTLLAIATALAEGSLDLRLEVPREEVRARLDELPGVGPWTREIIALRGLGDSDAFPVGDLGVRQGARALGLPDDARGLTDRARAWRPWRAYAVQALWATTTHPVAQLPGQESGGERMIERQEDECMTEDQEDERMTEHVVMDSPIGQLTLITDGTALTGVYMEEHKHAPTERGPERTGSAVPPVLDEAVRQLTAYFAGERTSFDLPVAAQGTDFQQRVWALLPTIPYGETATYGDLAKTLGNPGASRAVGLANGRNPVSIVVPCHRVVGASGALTGYGGGIERKQALLALEQGGEGRLW